MGAVTAVLDPTTQREAQLKQLAALAQNGGVGLLARLGATFQLGLEKQHDRLVEVARGTTSPGIGVLAVQLLAQEVTDDRVFVDIASDALSAVVAIAALGHIGATNELVRVTRQSGSQVVGGAVVGLLVERNAPSSTFRAVSSQAALAEVRRMAAGTNRRRD